MKVKKSKMRSYISGFLVLIMIFFSLTPLQTFAEVPSASGVETMTDMALASGVEAVTGGAISTGNHIFTGDGYSVEFTVESQWEGAFNATIKISNSSDTVIDDWSLEFELSNEITNIWNAGIQSHENNVYIIKNAAWNQDIPVGGSISFGFSALGNEIDYPSYYSIKGEKVLSDTSDYSINYVIDSDWITGFTAHIEIINTGETDIEDWSLEFDFDNNISSIWNSTIQEHTGNHYVLKNAGYNQNIRTGEKTTIGFIVASGNSSNLAGNMILAQIKDTVGPNGEDDDTELVDLGTSYFQDISDSDVVLDENSGLVYVKNQILVSAMYGLDYSVVEDIAENINARIVGYIELTNDYQLELNENVDIETLKSIIDYVASFSFIEDVSLNTAFKSDEDVVKTNDTEYTNDAWSESKPDGNNWGLEAIKVLSAWDFYSDFQSVKIGLIDNVFDENHEDLHYAHTWNNTSSIDSVSHGTHVSGIMAARFNNKKGIAGVAPKKALYGFSSEGTATSDYSTVMEYKYGFANLIGNNVKVINVSQNTGRLECFAASHGNEKAQNYVGTNANILGNFLQKLINKGYDFVIVAAAGNVNNLKYKKSMFATYGYVQSDDPSDESGGALAYYNSYLNAITLNDVKKRIITVGSIGLNSSSRYTYSNFSNIGDRVDIVAPGENIDSCIKNNSYGNLSGTSMASPYVAGTAGLLYSINPALSGAEVKRIITSKYSQTVSGYPLLDANACVKYAKNDFGMTPPQAPPTGIVTGLVKGMSNSGLSDVKLTAIRVSTGEANLDNYSSTTATGSNGEYEFILPEGTYNILISKNGYYPQIIKGVVITAGQTNYMEAVIVINLTVGMLSSDINGSVTNALNGNAISNAQVKFRKNWNNTSGAYAAGLFTGVISANTNSLGIFNVKLQTGNYTAEVVKNGYITGYFNVISTVNSGTQNMVLTPVINDNQYRIVLSWGSTPSDLDSHLLGTLEDNTSFHVYYSNKIYNYKGTTIAQLDLDDTTSYGPETITLTLNADLPGTYRYAVHDYTNRYSSSSNQLSLSGANVKVYQGNDLLRTYNVPINIGGTVWDVFEIKNGVINTLNTMSYQSSPESVN